MGKKLWYTPGMVSQKELRRLFDYNPKTGHLIRKVKVNRNTVIGSRAGCVTTERTGYTRRLVNVHGRLYKEHRIIWRLVHGDCPAQIDHINHDAADNRLCNLRAANEAENKKNLGRRRNNKSGVTGISWAKDRKKWIVQIVMNGKNTNIGRFDSFKEAYRARKSAERKAGYHPNHGK